MRRVRLVLMCFVGLWALSAEARISTEVDLSKSYSRPPYLKKAWDFKNIPHLFSICGNGVQEVGEECDDGNSEDHDACTSACRNARCGDGIVQHGTSSETVPSEDCDTGGLCAFDGVTVCKTDADCSEGVCMIKADSGCSDGAGEECDDGNDINTDLCLNTCVATACGDGIVQIALGEECDGGAGCGKNCELLWILPYKPITPIKPGPWEDDLQFRR